MMGPGKYDDICTLARQLTGASGCILIIVDGVEGSGFSAQGTEPVLRGLAGILEDTVAQVRADVRNHLSDS